MSLTCLPRRVSQYLLRLALIARRARTRAPFLAHID
jgi:hypothetical protein